MVWHFTFQKRLFRAAASRFLQKSPLNWNAKLKWLQIEMKVDHFQTNGWLSTALLYWEQRKASLGHDAVLNLKKCAIPYRGELAEPVYWAEPGGGAPLSVKVRFVKVHHCLKGRGNEQYWNRLWRTNSPTQQKYQPKPISVRLNIHYFICIVYYCRKQTAGGPSQTYIVGQKGRNDWLLFKI